MRTRVSILPVLMAGVFAAALSACSSDSDDKGPDAGKSPSVSVTDTTDVDCARYEDTAAKITEAQADIYSGTGGEAAVDELITELDALKKGAPADVQTALDDLGEAFRSAAEILENPTDENKAELAELTPKLAADGQKITAYVVSKCS